MSYAVVQIMGRITKTMERITIRLPTQQIAMLEKFVEAGEYPTVSEAVRHAVRELIEKHSGRVQKDSEQISFEV